MIAQSPPALKGRVVRTWEALNLWGGGHHAPGMGGHGWEWAHGKGRAMHDPYASYMSKLQFGGGGMGVDEEGGVL